jgi:tetratricopeptide (TPR) repeat protein
VNTKQHPTIFISSTFRDLETHRKAVHKLIKDQFGWHPWAFEIDGNSQSCNTLIALEEQIKKADLIICIIGSNYGSELAHEAVSFTEWELHIAAYYQKDVKVYIQRNNSTRHKRLFPLIGVIRDELIGHFSSEFSSELDLCEKIEQDLNDWSKSKPTPTRIAIQQLIDDPYCYLFIDNLCKNKCTLPAHRAVPFERDFLLKELITLAEKHEKGLYSITLDRSVVFFSKLIHTYPPNINDKSSLELWASFLSIFYNVLAITNYLRSGPISSISLAKALFQIYQILGDKAGMVKAAHCLSGVMNSAGLPQALLWNDFALQRHEYIKNSASIWDSRGSILRTQGNLLQAEEALTRALWAFEGPEATLGYIRARLAGIQLQAHKPKKALRNLELAGKAISNEGLSRVIFIRELVPYLIFDNENSEAEIKLKEGISICEQLGLERPKTRLVELALSIGLSP